MATVEHPTATNWTAADLVERFGAIPLWRIRSNPPPGSATEEDAIELNDRHKCLCELVDGVLVEKTVSSYESYLAMLMGRLLGNFVADKRLGVVLGADGMLRLAPGLIRIPDLSFLSWDRLPEPKLPRDPVWGLAADLAVEVISQGNTPEEMRRKVGEYFAAGARLVWYVYPANREVHVFRDPERFDVAGEKDVLDGGEVLPGFQLSLVEFFAEPQKP